MNCCYLSVPSISLLLPNMKLSTIAPVSNCNLSGFGSSTKGSNMEVNTRSKSKSWPVSCSIPRDNLSSERRVSEVMAKQAALFNIKKLQQRFSSTEEEPNLVLPPNLTSLNQAYDLCREEVNMHKDSTFYLGTLLMKPEQRRAFWAVGVWGKGIDDLIDGPNASSEVSPSDLDIWDSRLEQIFEGRPGDAVEAVLADSVSRFHLDIQPFKDLIEGMRMDLTKTRYTNFDELSLYCYHVAGSVCLISLQILGTAPESQATTESLFRSALAFGTACQLTNILRDIGEDARRGRVYLPRDELAEAELSEEDIFTGMVTDKWRSFMNQQIQRTMIYFVESEKLIPELSAPSRWGAMATLLLYRQILDEIVANDYNNFTKRARASKPKKFLTLAIAYARSMLLTPSKSKIIENKPSTLNTEIQR